MFGGLSVMRCGTRAKVFGAVLMTTTAMVGIVATPAVAQTASAQRHFDIPAQSLPQALMIFGRQAGLQVTADGSVASGKTSAPIRGNLAPAEALSRLLAGTGLTFRFVGNNGVQVEPAPQAADGVVQLGPVRVEGASGSGSGNSVSLTSDPAATEGTGAYTATGPSKTATGLAMSLRETPQSVTVVTRQKIEDFNLNTLEQVLEQTPGVYVYRQGDSILFQARGATIDNFQTDGTRSGIASGSTGAPFQNNFAGSEMADIDRIEVLKGSAGLLQGDGQPTATVNMIRKKPTREFQAHINASAGSWDTYRTEADLSGPLNDSGAVRGRVVGSYKDADSYRDNVSNKYAVLYGTIDIDLSANTLLNFGASYKEQGSKGNAGYQGFRVYNTSGVYDGLVSRSWNAGAPWSGFNRKSLNLFASLEHHFDNGWDVKIRASNEDVRTPDWLRAAVVYPGVSMRAWEYDVKENTKSFTADISGPYYLFGRKQELLVGANYSEASTRNNESHPDDDWFNVIRSAYNSSFDYFIDGGSGYPRPTDFYPSTVYRDKTKRFGAYVASRLNPIDEIKIIAGLRLSNYKYDYRETDVWQGASSISNETNYDHAGVITPYAGAVLDLHKNLSVYASYTSIFQPTNLQDEQGKVLKPQEGTTYEVGSKAEFYNGLLNVSFAHFWKRWQNYYELSGGLTPSGDAAYRNVNGATERGFELEMSGELAPGWQAQGSFVLNNSSIGKDSGNIVSPRHQFKLYSTYRFSGGLDGLTAGGGARWQSKTVVNGYGASLEQSPYWVFDLMAGYRIDRHWSANVNVSNLFDKKYFSGVSDMSGWGLYAIWGAPRSVNASIRYSF